MSEDYYHLALDESGIHCRIKTVHKEGCPILEEVGDKRYGPYPTPQEAWKGAERVYPDTSVRYCEVCISQLAPPTN